MINKNLKRIMLILSMMITIVTMILLLAHKYLPVSVIKMLPVIVVMLLGLIMVVVILQMLISKQTLIKLASLPMMFSCYIVAFFLVKLPIYQMLISSMTGEDYNVDSDILFDNMRLGFTIFQYGIWISIVPLIIGVIILNNKTTVKTPKNIHEFYPLKAKVISFEYTNARINNNDIYQLVVEIQDYENPYIVTKDIRVSADNTFSFAPGDYFDVLVDPDKKQKVLIKRNDMYY